MKQRIFRAADEEYERWRLCARSQNMGLSKWLRRAANERAALEKVLEEQSDTERGSSDL